MPRMAITTAFKRTARRKAVVVIAHISRNVVTVPNAGKW